MGGFTPKASPSPPPAASKAEDDDDDSDDDDTSEDDDDGDAGSSGIDEISTWHSYPLSLVTKMRSNFVYEGSHT